jgi:hypothetical protein
LSNQVQAWQCITAYEVRRTGGLGGRRKGSSFLFEEDFFLFEDTIEGPKAPDLRFAGTERDGFVTDLTTNA